MTLQDWQVDHLILLVGGNPLPNYVAARLLARHGATLYLVHTQRTRKIAENLVEVLKLPAEGDELGGGFAAYPFIQVDEGAPRDIFDKVTTLVKSLPSSECVGLNYTGGNRPMSVHAYDAVDEARSDALFSYLDANRLEMLIHDQKRTTHRERADRWLKLPLERLFKLHRLEPKSGVTPSDKPLQPKLAAALAELHTTDEGASAWSTWLKKRKSENWADLLWDESGLEKVEAAMRDMCGGCDPTPERVAAALGYKSLSSCADWLQGKWLENYVLAQLLQTIQGRADTCDALMGVKRVRTLKRDSNSKPADIDDFDLDVVVMRAYQLFIFSCIISSPKKGSKIQKGDFKKHLLEVYVRARQAGGDEARVGLVCNYPDPKRLEAEISTDLDVGGKIKVFGQPHLVSLAEHIREWLDKQP